MSEPQTRGGARAAEAPLSVLVVDDEEAILFALDDYLSSTGWRVATASTPAAADDLLAGGEFRAAIVDLRLSPDDEAVAGLEVVRRIRERSPSTRVVLLTAYGSPGVAAEAERLGVDSLLAKPQPLARLEAHLRQLVGALPGSD